MTRQAIRRGAGFVIWPESSTPFRFEDDPAAAAQVRALAPTGARADPLRQRSVRARRERAPTTFYNSAFLVRADGTTGGVYRKMHLVPFGEYVPLKRCSSSPRRWSRRCRTSRRARTPRCCRLADHLVSTAICYEVVYPDLVRRFVVGGSELLTTITNDAWFGPTSAPYQHFAQASMRAIEEGRYLVRSANTGISGIVDPYGRVLAAQRNLPARGAGRRGALSDRPRRSTRATATSSPTRRWWRRRCCCCWRGGRLNDGHTAEGRARVK